jgi:homoserine dehydrogenase
MKKLSVGVVGMGIVGSGTVSILIKERERFIQQFGVDIELVAIADVRDGLAEKYSLPSALFTKDYRNLLLNKDINVIVELVGGTTVAADIVKGALKAGKHVVTANKALLADQGDELFKLAEENGCVIGFEASVCGGIPVIRALKEGLSANNIISLFGILNGTANFILTKMRFENKSFAEALKEAQRLGFAEADPTYDVEGLDAANKLAILASLAFGQFYHWKDVYVEGITQITDLDISYAREMGFVIKLLGVARKTASGIPALSVAPTLIPEDEIIAEVNHEYNGVFIEGDSVGHTLYTGKGAGSLPTGSAVVSDIVHIASYGSLEKDHYKMYYRGGRGKVLPVDQHLAEYYLRLTVVDAPGVMAKISGELGSRSISIAMLMQKQSTSDGNAVVVIRTHRTTYKQITDAVDSISALDIIKTPVVKFRIIRDLYHE